MPDLRDLPFWTIVGGGAVLCGALAANPTRWHRETLLTLSIAFLLVTVAWIGLWTMAAGRDWVSLLRAHRAWSPTPLPALPYTRPDSPAGRLGRRLGRLVGWWGDLFWPMAGTVFFLCLLAVSLAVVLSLLLPPRVWWLDLALVALVVLGMAQRRRSSSPLAARSFLCMGLAWLTGYLALARFRWYALLLALLLSLAAWGVLRAARGMAGGPWLLHGGLLGAAVLLVILGHPLAAGAVALLAFAPLLAWLALRPGDPSTGISRRTWPWLLAAMLVASLALA